MRIPCEAEMAALKDLRELAKDYIVRIERCSRLVYNLMNKSVT